MWQKIKQQLTKEYKILGRSKNIKIISDFVLLVLVAIFLVYYVNDSISRLNIKPIILNTISQMQNNKNTETIIEEKKCTTPTITASANYYNNFGDQIGIGPNPPILGIPTNYWIFFNIKNNKNSLENITLSSVLGNNETLTGNKSIKSGNFYMLYSSKEIIWEIKNLSSNENTSIGFEISFTPNENNLNAIPTLIKNINLSATDTYCGKTVSTTFQNLDTGLMYDKFGKNSGKVTNIDNNL